MKGNGGIIGVFNQSSEDSTSGVWGARQIFNRVFNDSWPVLNLFIATGGTVTDITDGGVNYRVHTFTSSGTFEVESGGKEVEYLVVAGGGGGGSAGQLGSETSGGDGGNGIESTISGSATYYAGGGGGGIDDRDEPNPGDYNGGSGGLGGGGNGGDTSQNATGENDPQDGVANTGGGGGGSGLDPATADQMGGDGGSGIVIIRYQI